MREKHQSIGYKEQLLIDIVNVGVTLISFLFLWGGMLARVFGKRSTLRRFFLYNAEPPDKAIRNGKERNDCTAEPILLYASGSVY
jgi:hypothetical protein